MPERTPEQLGLSTIRVRSSKPAMLVRFVSRPIRKRARSAGASGAPETGLPALVRSKVAPRSSRSTDQPHGLSGELST